MKAAAQSICQATSLTEVGRVDIIFARRWFEVYSMFVARLLQSLSGFFAFLQCQRTLLGRLRTMNIIERCFVGVRRRTRPMSGTDYREV
ncbi:MAG TPA: hypothetical protein VN647_05375 [Nitrospira sp.]|nr:hypothetical protein [Nitrospira sp.]